eukprot:PITA_33027
MVEEYDSIVRNNVWDVVLRQENKSVVSSHRLYNVKKAAYGSVEKHKERFVSRGFSKVEGIDYDETFAPIARIDNYFSRLGFTKSEVDVNLFHIVVKGKLLIIILYVDDLILTSDDQLIMSCKEDLARELEMKEMSLMHYFLGMELSQAMVQPTKMFWKAIKHVLRYLRGTSQYGLWYRRTKGVKLQGFTDADWARSPSDRKSTSGGILNLMRVVVSWYSKKQRSVALNTTEVEYMTAI